jgi:hypothetical protein
MSRSFSDNRLLLPSEQFGFGAPVAVAPVERVAGVTEVDAKAQREDCVPPEKPKVKQADAAKPRPKVVKPASVFSTIVPKPSANFSEQLNAAKKRFAPPPKVKPVVPNDC